MTDTPGGSCGPERPPEIGVLPMVSTPEGRADPIFDRMDERQHTPPRSS